MVKGRIIGVYLSPFNFSRKSKISRNSENISRNSKSDLKRGNFEMKFLDLRRSGLEINTFFKTL